MATRFDSDFFACDTMCKSSFGELTIVISLEQSIRTALASLSKSVKNFDDCKAFVIIEAEIPPGRTYGDCMGMAILTHAPFIPMWKITDSTCVE